MCNPSDGGRNVRMRDDRVIDWLSIGAHRGDDVISAWTHGRWRRAHLNAVRIDYTNPIELVKEVHTAARSNGSAQTQAVARPHTPHKFHRPPIAGSRSPSPARMARSSNGSPNGKPSHSHQLYSEDPWKLFIGFENAYQLKMRDAPNFAPISDAGRHAVELPEISVSHLLDGAGKDAGQPVWQSGSVADLLVRVHKADMQYHHEHAGVHSTTHAADAPRGRTRPFEEQLPLDLLRAVLDKLGWSCFRYRYNYSSNKTQESMQLAQYVDTTILSADHVSQISKTDLSSGPIENGQQRQQMQESNFRLNHRFLILSVHPSTIAFNDMRAQVAGKALITALFKHMAGVSRGMECEVFIISMRGTKARLWRIVFEPEYLADVARGLEPVKPALLWADVSGHVSKDTGSLAGDLTPTDAIARDAGEVDLMRKEGRQLMCDKLERIRRIFHCRI